MSLTLFQLTVALIAMFMLGMGAGVELMKGRYYRVLALFEREKQRCEILRGLKK